MPAANCDLDQQLMVVQLFTVRDVQKQYLPFAEVSTSEFLLIWFIEKIV